MAYKENDHCLNKAFKDEKIFVLMTRDLTAPSVVIEWIKHNIGIQPREKLIEALDCAIEMHERCAEMNIRKRYETVGWKLIQKELPSDESHCELLVDLEGTKTFSSPYETEWNYLSSVEGFDKQNVLAWRNPRRMT